MLTLTLFNNIHHVHVGGQASSEFMRKLHCQGKLTPLCRPWKRKQTGSSCHRKSDTNGED